MSNATEFLLHPETTDDVTLAYNGAAIVYSNSIFDVYIGGTLWQSYDGYTASTGDVTATIQLNGSYSFEIRNRYEKNLSSTGYRVRFKQLVLESITYNLLGWILSSSSIKMGQFQSSFS